MEVVENSIIEILERKASPLFLISIVNFLKEHCKFVGKSLTVQQMKKEVKKMRRAIIAKILTNITVSFDLFGLFFIA